MMRAFAYARVSTGEQANGHADRILQNEYFVFLVFTSKSTKYVGDGKEVKYKRACRFQQTLAIYGGPDRTILKLL